MHTDSRLELRPVEDHDPYPAKHRQKPTPPPWAAALDGYPLVGEGPTEKIRYPQPPSQALLMPLPARAEGAALEAETRYLPKPAPEVTLLGRILSVGKRVLRGRP